MLGRYGKADGDIESPDRFGEFHNLKFQSFVRPMGVRLLRRT